MRTIGLMTALAMAFGSALLLGAPAIAEEGQQQPGTEVATEVADKGAQETPPVEAAPPEREKGEKGQESEKAEEPAQD